MKFSATRGNLSDMNASIPLEQVKNILVIIFKYHGDVLLSSPLFSALKERFPEANIDVYLYKETLPMLMGHPAIRNFFTYDQQWKKLSSWQKMKKEAVNLKTIRDTGYDMTINLTKGDRGAIVSRVSKAPYRIGYEADKGMVGQSHCYTHLVRWTSTKRHTVERNLDTLRILGIHPSEESRDLVFALSPVDRFRVNHLLEGRENFILIHPASRMSYKHWPAEKFAELILRFLDQGETVVVSGGPGEEERGFIDSIFAELGEERKKVLDLVGLMTLKELGALIEASKLLVSVDSVPLHMASAVKAKTIVLFGPSCDQTWGPWRNPHAVVVAMSKSCRACDDEGCGNTWMSDCLNELPVSMVWHACQDLLRISEQELV